ncbi:hypothetical protein [Bradyrhizobium sp. JYMT SZCCT0428]|uniref:hypothetical protein n=1 Tax=Bradyrhizobium sp. JYMT SZCCT0428 TaxID=2807673 RepID=UPI001BA5EF78|nr:hypothetical protein [Bradyrhizobium sp. JYMT SZCCT0428]MBR1150133.1 hypothetical protein [Bradyrhizobium sp. JYMT SZCCT0428]
MQHHCLTCAATTYHWHLHDTAHGIPETHMAGSERFVCKPCKRTTFAIDAGSVAFPFVLDGQANRKLVA